MTYGNNCNKNVAKLESTPGGIINTNMGPFVDAFFFPLILILHFGTFEPFNGLGRAARAIVSQGGGTAPTHWAPPWGV